MATFDITRLLEQPRKQYVGARIQQGRLLLDSDFNEGGAASDEDRRSSIEDLVGAKGTPDDGFAIGAPLALPLPAGPVQSGVLRPGTALPPQLFQIDGLPTAVRPVSIRAGKFYLGGLRYDMDDAEPVPLQRDFLQMRPSDLPALDTSATEGGLATAGPFRNLYYLHAWEQAVTEIEDEEVLEVALGGRDTSTRTRRMRQVAIFSDFEATDAADTAWRRLLAELQADGSTYDANSGELLSPGRLQLSFIDDPEVLDQLAVARQCRDCNPDPGTSFLAADNATIQIRLTSPNTYVWAFDNGAPLFRVRVTGLGDPSAAEIRVFMMTPPIDDTHWPLENRVVEIVPFGAVLDGDVPPAVAHPHFKKVADRVGAFSVVRESFDPDTQSFTLDPSIGVDAIRDFVVQWDANHPAAANLELTSTEGDQRFFYMRLWHEAADATQVEIPISFDAAGPPLAGTNIVPVFASPGRRGDYWTAAIRPETPDRVVPFDLALEGGVAPHGPHDFYAPLALLKGQDDVVTIIADRRPRITRATDGGCVTFTVGDGFQSFGDFTSIQEALDELPEEGGLIQVRQGTYREPVIISNLSAHRNITIEGCGDSTILETSLDELALSPVSRPAAITITTQDPPGSQPSPQPVLTDPFRRITVRGLRIHAVDAPGIVIQQANDPTPSVFDVEIAGVAILAATPISPHPRIALPDAQAMSVPLIDIGNGAQNLVLRGMLLEPAGRTAIRVANSSHVTIDDVAISGSPVSTSSPGPPMIDVQAGCDFVTIRDAVLSTFGQVGIATTGASRDTTILRATVVAGPHRNIFGRVTPSRTGIDVDGAERVRVERCLITMDDTVSENAGIVVAGQQITVLANHVEVLARCFDSPPDPQSPADCRDLRMLAWGGIQIRGNSTGIEVRENEILGGVGHGITLGSVVWTLSSPVVTRREGAGRGQMSTRRDGQMGPNGNIRSALRPARRLLTAQNEGPLTDIVIADNRIEQMSGNGISALTVLGMADRDDLIDITGLRIESNTIVDNVRFPAEDVPVRSDALPFTASLVGVGVPIPFLPIGGVVLGMASNADIRGNVIINNGSSAVLPTNGIFILCGDSIRIANNRLLGNGGRPFPDSPIAPQPSPRAGVRAGIAVMLAGTGNAGSLSDIDAELGSRGNLLESDGTSLRIVNNCVRHPEGRALYAVATGPVAVERNFLSSEGNHGADTLNDSFSIGDIVYIQNLGAPWEADLGPDGQGTPEPDEATYGTHPFEATSYFNTVLPTPPQSPTNPRVLVGEGGAVLFNNNQVVFDWEVLRLPKVGFRPPLSYFPVALLTVDHLGIAGNQLFFRLRGQKIRNSPPMTSPPVFGFREPVLSHVFGVGATISVSGNRVSEAIEDAILSIFTVGELLNLSALNQSTHQVLVLNNSQRNAPLGARPNDNTPLNQLQSDENLTLRVNQVIFDADRSITSDTISTLKDFVVRFVNILLRPAT